jgi:hypothetical protein
MTIRMGFIVVISLSRARDDFFIVPPQLPEDRIPANQSRKTGLPVKKTVLHWKRLNDGHKV